MPMTTSLGVSNEQAPMVVPYGCWTSRSRFDLDYLDLAYLLVAQTLNLDLDSSLSDLLYFPQVLDFVIN